MKPYLVALALVATACGTETASTATTLVPVEGRTSTTIDQPDDSTAIAPSTTTLPGGLHIIVQPDSSGQLPADVLVQCSTPKFPASALGSTRPIADSLDQVEAEMRGFLDNREGQHWPQDDWLILHETEDLVLLVHVRVTDDSGKALDEARVASMTIERVGGDWKWAGAQSGGPCLLETSLPDSLSRVDWRIDPAADPLSPTSTRIEVLVTERACASGQAVGDRLLGPEVVMTETAVLIAFAATAQAGFQTCPGNPEQAAVFDLPEPLGDRELVDGMAVIGNLSDYIN